MPKPTFGAIDYAADKILSHASVGLLAFGAALTIWEISGSVRAVGGALNQIYDTEDERPIWIRFGIWASVALQLLGVARASFLPHFKPFWILASLPVSALLFLVYCLAWLLKKMLLEALGLEGQGGKCEDGWAWTDGRRDGV